MPSPGVLLEKARMNKLFVDTNVFLRYLTNDDPLKADKAEAVFRNAVKGKLKLITSLLVIAEIVWTLESFYGLPKSEISAKITTILNTPNLEVPEDEQIFNALELYAQKNMDFIDAYNAFYIKNKTITKVLTYDKKHFARIEWVESVEP